MLLGFLAHESFHRSCTWAYSLAQARHFSKFSTPSVSCTMSLATTCDEQNLGQEIGRFALEGAVHETSSTKVSCFTRTKGELDAIAGTWTLWNAQSCLHLVYGHLLVVEHQDPEGFFIRTLLRSLTHHIFFFKDYVAHQARYQYDAKRSGLREHLWSQAPYHPMQESC